MAVPTDTFTGSDLDVFRPQVWGSKVNEFFREELILANFFTDRSDELKNGGDTIHTPNTTEMSAATKTNGAAVTLGSPTETKVDLVVDTWKEVSFLIEDREAAQVKASYTLQERYAKNAAFTAASELEGAIAALFTGFSGSVGASSSNLADSDIRVAISTLANSKVPGVRANTKEVAFIMHPNTIWRQLMGLDKFTLVQNTAGADPVMKGAVGTLYGIPVIESVNVPNVSGSDGRANLLAHKDAIHFATLALPAGNANAYSGAYGVRLQSNYMPEYLGTLCTADVVYGVIENRDSAGVKIITHATNA